MKTARAIIAIGGRSLLREISITVPDDTPKEVIDEQLLQKAESNSIKGNCMIVYSEIMKENSPFTINKKNIY